MRRNRQQIDAHSLDVDRRLARRLRRVRVEQNAALAAKPGDFRDGLQHSDLVVSGHGAHEDCSVGEGALDVIRVHQAVRAHPCAGHAEPFLLQALRRVEHRLMLCRQGDNVVAPAAMGPGRSLNRQIVRLGCARGEDDLLRAGVDKLRDLLAGRLHSRFRFPPQAVVAAGRVTVDLGEIREHRFEHAGVYRRRSVIVHVNWKLHRTPGSAGVSPATAPLLYSSRSLKNSPHMSAPRAPASAERCLAAP